MATQLLYFQWLTVQYKLCTLGMLQQIKTKVTFHVHISEGN